MLTEGFKLYNEIYSQLSLLNSSSSSKSEEFNAKLSNAKLKN